jgi:SpoVK/Ycf46/Vps4 family AAA+-type ATPase
VPPDDYRRFSSSQWRSRHSTQRANEFFSRLRESFWRGWNHAKGGSTSTRPASNQPSQRLLALSPLCLLVAVLTIAAAVGGLTSRASVLIVAIFLVWVVHTPLRDSPRFARKFTKITILSLLVGDWVSLIASGEATRLVGTVLGDRKHAGGWILMTGMFVWWAGFLWIVLSGRKAVRGGVRSVASETNESAAARSLVELRVPQISFADVGGMEEAKQQIREIVESRLNPQKYAAYRVNRNGILLYGPRGSGKTFLSEATAGEFGLNFHYVSPTKLITTWTGESEASIRAAFMRARANLPALLFIDEIDALGSIRQNPGGGDPGGAGRSYNNMAIELMQSIDEARPEPGLVIMAATNVIDGLDEALIREGRFDVKIRVDLPDEGAREKIFGAQLSVKPRERFDLRDFARRTPGASAAKIRALVDQAALFAARESRKIEARDLQKALEESGGKDRPLFQPVEWEDVVLDKRVEQELRSLIRLVSNPFAAERMGLQVPMGVLLLGRPGTGKTMIARLVATQSKRSFLPITSAEITEPKAVSRVFSRARENNPSLIFMDEMESLLPANPGYLNQYYVQIVITCRSSSSS